MTGNKPHDAISRASGSVRLARRRFLREQRRKNNERYRNSTMSKSEGIGESESIERIKEPTEAEERAIREEFEEVVTARTGRLHPVGDAGEPLCSDSETHGVEGWSRPKPFASYPIGYAPICRYCVRDWRDSR